MALPHRQVDLRHLFVGGLDRRRSGRKGVLTLPGPALPKHLRLTGLVERLKHIFSEKPVEIPDDAAVVAELPRPVVVPSAEKKSHGPCRGLVTAREVRRHVGESQPLQAVLEPDDVADVVPPPPPPPFSLLPSWEPVTLEALDAEEENAERGDADVAPSSSAASPKSPGSPLVVPLGREAAWSGWRHLPTSVEVAERPPELPELDLPDASEAADESLSPGSSCQGGANARDEGDQDIISRWCHVQVMDSKEMDESKPSQGSGSSSSTEAYERYYSRRPSALQAKSPTPEPQLAMPTSAKYLERTGRPPSLPGWSLRFYKPEALPRVSVPRHVKVEPMDAVQVAIRPPRALNQTQKRFRATRQKRRQPELPALEVNADGTFDFPSVRRLLASWEDFEPQVPVRKRLTQEWKPSLPEECVQRSNSQGADAHSRSGSRSGSRSNSRNDTPRDAEMKVEDVRSGVDSSMCSPLRMRLNSICDEAKSQTLVGGESCRPCNSPTNSPYGRASEAADEAGDDSDPFCMAVTVD